MGVIMQRDGECGTTVQGNDGGWSSDGVVLWLVKKIHMVDSAATNGR
jgi:hypothetical protein